MTHFTFDDRRHFDAPSVIRVKRDGGRLSDEAIDWVIDAYTHGRVADEQMSALLMAIFLRGMDRGRSPAVDRRDGRLRSPTGLRRSAPRRRTAADGGQALHRRVGDKITIPWCRCSPPAGRPCPRRPGAGSATGGTLDKLESIPGFSAEVPIGQVRRQLAEIGAAIFAAGELAPADRKIYALRDVTGTVESLPLIASSVMSKKLAEGAEALVLDVKVGCGAFLKTEAESRSLPPPWWSWAAARGSPPGRCSPT